jgi:hypothetical protein
VLVSEWLRGTAVNGALIAMGALAVVDNVIVHWILGWHRLIDDWSHEANLAAESAMILLGAVMLAIGVRGERSQLRARRSGQSPTP